MVLFYSNLLDQLSNENPTLSNSLPLIKHESHYDCDWFYINLMSNYKRSHDIYLMFRHTFVITNSTNFFTFDIQYLDYYYELSGELFGNSKCRKSRNIIENIVVVPHLKIS